MNKPPPSDPDAVASELNALVTNPARKPALASETARLEAWLAGMASRRASDLLLVAGAPPCILHQEITITRKAGSFTVEESLVTLVRSGWIERNEAMLRAGHVQEFESGLAAAGL